MSRTRRRVSRALIGALACTLALGLVFWLHNLTKTKAAPVAPVDAHQPPPPPVGTRTLAGEPASAGGSAGASVEPPKPAGLVTQTPTAAPKPLTPAAVVTPVAHAGEPAPGSGERSRT
ncbi:MAG: hypothetical protein WBD40_11460, partial [Tepidisphaeraceae bacterium]